MTIAPWHVVSNLLFTNSSLRSVNYRLCLRIAKKQFLNCDVYFVDLFVALLSSRLTHLSWTCWVVRATEEGSKKTFRFPCS
jgi:hypothetical protein